MRPRACSSKTCTPKWRHIRCAIRSNIRLDSTSQSALDRALRQDSGHIDSLSREEPESPPVAVAHYLELILHSGCPLELDRQVPDVGAGDLAQLKIIRPWVYPVTDVDRPLQPGRECAAALGHGQA